MNTIPFDTIPFDVVGFDLDGTLLDTSKDIGLAVNQVLTEAGRMTVPLDDVRSLIGGGGLRMLERALERDGGVPDRDTVKAMHRSFLRHYEANICVHSCLFPGGEAMLDALASQGVRLAVVTNKLEALAVKLLDEIGLARRFYTILGGDTLGPGRAKPAPDLLLEMMARAPGAARAAFVGDSSYDTGAAKSAGLPCVAVSFGFNNLPAHELGADAVIDHFDELIPVLAKLG